MGVVKTKIDIPPFIAIFYIYEWRFYIKYMIAKKQKQQKLLCCKTRLKKFLCLYFFVYRNFEILIAKNRVK